MNKYIDRIAAATEQFILSRVQNNSLLAEYYRRSDKRIDYKKQSKNYQKQEIKDWKTAILAATDPENPRRGLLMRFYESLLLDLHLGSCIDNRILPIQCAKFKLTDKNGVEDADAHKLLEKPWFLNLIKMVVNSTFIGTTLIELFEVNEYGEIKEVKEIPQSNFLAHKGIIINEEWDDDGTSYKEGIFSNYYVQIGGDSCLGLLNQLAMIVLAKKLGIGSWMSYIEKFGVPPIFLTTDRMDTTRIDELFDMLMNFKSNGFVIAQGQEKIDFPTNSIDGYQSFKALHDTCDAAISKRLLGGTGTTDEKSFVGSAEVHERLLKYRNQVDKLLFKFYFNEAIKPRLVKLSSVYAPLADLTFDFDEKETLTLKETIALIKDLSQYYEFDIKEIAKITGLPIVAVRSAISQGTDQSIQKKKPDGSVTNMPRYAPFAYSGISIQAATWDAAIERMADQLYSGQLKPQELDRDLVLKNYSALNKEAAAAWGDGYHEHPLTRKLRENLLNFSGAKSYNLMREIGALAKESNSKQQFVDQAKKTVHLHNETYLTVEKKFAANSSSSARNFEAFLADADIYPNLKNRTMGDSSVRDVHAANEGVVKPLNEWKVIPPYDPGCRCWLEQTIDPPTEKGLSNTDKHWANNPILSGQIFVDEHSYFTGIPKNIKRTVLNNADLMKEYAPYTKAIDINGDKKVFVSDFADTIDLPRNMEAARLMAEQLKINVYIRPHSSIEGKKNPELGIGKSNNIADLKTFKPFIAGKEVKLRNHLKNAFDSARKQNVGTIVCDISQNVESVIQTQETIASKLGGEMKASRKIERVIFINNGKVSSITRSQVLKKEFNDLFNQLY